MISNDGGNAAQIFVAENTCNIILDGHNKTNLRLAQTRVKFWVTRPPQTINKYPIQVRHEKLN